jgi:hypothetical protein
VPNTSKQLHSIRLCQLLFDGERVGSQNFNFSTPIERHECIQAFLEGMAALIPIEAFFF